jgi:hypothetical protein
MVTLDNNLEEFNNNSSPKQYMPLVIPNFIEGFCPHLVDRLHTIVDRYCELDKFTLFTCLLDRSSEDSINNQRLILIGADKQKEWLKMHNDIHSHTELDKKWKLIENVALDKENHIYMILSHTMEINI